MNIIHTFQPNPAADVAAHLSADEDFFARCRASGAYGRMVADYEQQIDRNLPGRMWIDWAESQTRIVSDCHLYADGFDLMVNGALLGIDLKAIITRHDPDEILNEGACNCCGQTLIRTRSEVYCSDPVCGSAQSL